MADEPQSSTVAARELAIATRLLEWLGILDYSGHIGVRTESTDTILIQPRNVSRSKLSPQQVLTVGTDGRVRQGNDRPPSETAIHLEIFAARKDVNCVLHCHMEEAIFFTLMKDRRLTPLRSSAWRWRSGIPTHPVPNHIRSSEQGRALAQTLNEHNAALIRSHGMVIVAESIPGLFCDAVHFLENARATLAVLQAGAEPFPLSEEELDAVAKSYDRRHHARKVWEHYTAKGREAGVLPEAWFGEV